VLESLQDQESALPVKRRRLQGMKALAHPELWHTRSLCFQTAWVDLTGDLQQLWICLRLSNFAALCGCDFASFIILMAQVPRPVHDDSFDVADFFNLSLPELRQATSMGKAHLALLMSEASTSLAEKD